MTASHLPAPIQEITETPTPVAEQSAKPTRAKSSASSLSSEKNEKAAVQKSVAKSSPDQSRKTFAGTWIGTIPAFPTGPQETVLTVDPTETKMQQTWVGHRTAVAQARIEGDTLRATYTGGVTYTWSLTPLPDGVSARARLQAFMNDQTAIFHRVVK